MTEPLAPFPHIHVPGVCCVDSSPTLAAFLAFPDIVVPYGPRVRTPPMPLPLTPLPLVRVPISPGGGPLHMLAAVLPFPDIGTSTFPGISAPSVTLPLLAHLRTYCHIRFSFRRGHEPHRPRRSPDIAAPQPDACGPVRDTPGGGLRAAGPSGNTSHKLVTCQAARGVSMIGCDLGHIAAIHCNLYDADSSAYRPQVARSHV
jgi:hypothetical protein